MNVLMRMGAVMLAAVFALLLVGCGEIGDQAKEAGAQVAADAAAQHVQSALQSAGFSGVNVTSETETVNGQNVVVLVATVTLPQQLQSGCKLEYESQVTTPGIYLDEIITPTHRDGVEVKGAARNTMSPRSAFDYVLQNHRECVIKGAPAPTR